MVSIAAILVAKMVFYLPWQPKCLKSQNLLHDMVGQWIINMRALKVIFYH